MSSSTSVVFIVQRSCVSEFIDLNDEPYKQEEVYTNEHDACCKAIEKMISSFMDDDDNIMGQEALRSKLIGIMVKENVSVKKLCQEVQEALTEASLTSDANKLWFYTVRGIEPIHNEVDENAMIALALEHLSATENKTNYEQVHKARKKCPRAAAAGGITSNNRLTRNKAKEAKIAAS